MSIRELIDPSNSALIFIDHQPQMSLAWPILTVNC
jgi:hypothetical protein